MTRSPNQPITRREMMGFLGMVVGMFMAILDIQIVNSSLQDIQAGISASADEINWVQTSYLVAEVIMIPLSGWLSRALSTRTLFVSCCAIFTLASAACAFSWNLSSMISFRILQGFFGGAMIPTVFATIFVLFPPHMRPKMSIVVGLVVTVAPTLGPVFGGWLNEQVSWHALFLVNLIPGLVICFSTWKLVDIDKPDPSLWSRIDYIGMALIVIGLGSLQYVLEEGARDEWFDSGTITLFFIVAVVALTCLIIYELKTEHPIIDLHAFQDRNFTIGCFYSLILGCGLYTAVFLMPVYLGNIKGLNSLQIGTYIMVTGAFQFLSAPLAGMLSKKLDLRIILGMGMGLYGVGTWMNGQLTAESGFWDFFFPQAVRGLSLMFCFLPINTLTYGTLPPSRIKGASGLYNLMRNLGGAIGLAVVNTFLTNGTKGNYALLRENVTAGSAYANSWLEAVADRASSFGLANPEAVAVKLMTSLAMREATVMTFNTLFHLVSIVFFVGFCITPLIHKVDPNVAPPEDAH
jgi:MFS transporter, DHA2 family, multidrug resistance protein